MPDPSGTGQFGEVGATRLFVGQPAAQAESERGPHESCVDTAKFCRAFPVWPCQPQKPRGFRRPFIEYDGETTGIGKLQWIPAMPKSIVVPTAGSLLTALSAIAATSWWTLLRVM
jgi:hypothetical protein